MTEDMISKHPWFNPDNKAKTMDLTGLDIIITKMSKALHTPHVPLAKLIEDHQIVMGADGERADCTHIFADEYTHVLDIRAEEAYSMGPHNHGGCNEILHVISGQMIIFLDDGNGKTEKIRLKPGMTVYIEGDREHSMRFIEDSVVRVVLIPPDHQLLTLKHTERV